MKVAIVLALFVVIATVSAQNDACTTVDDCTGTCDQHGAHTHVWHCQHGICHCHSQHGCDGDDKCSCNSGFTGSCDHGHCHCHHDH